MKCPIHGDNCPVDSGDFFMDKNHPDDMFGVNIMTDNQNRNNQGGEGRSIDKVFAYHKPSSISLMKITNLRAQYSQLKNLIETSCPPSRERAVALTELETSAMWAIKSVVSNDPDSELQG